LLVRYTTPPKLDSIASRSLRKHGST
jgi:hypothetical protein